MAKQLELSLSDGVHHRPVPLHLSSDLIRQPDIVETALRFTAVLSFFLFCRDTTFSSRAECGHQMYPGGSVVGEAFNCKLIPIHALVKFIRAAV